MLSTIESPVEIVETVAPYERNNLVAVRISVPDGNRSTYMHDDTETALTRVRAAVRNATHWPDQIEDIMSPVIAGLMAVGTAGVRINGWEILISVNPKVIAQIETY